MPLLILAALTLAAAVATLLLVIRTRAAAAALTSRLDTFEQRLTGLVPALREESRLAREELRSMLTAQQSALESRLSGFGQQQTEQLAALRRESADGRTGFEAALSRHTTALRTALDTNLEQLRQGNEAKLEQMRLTVDEKLQGTLETRLGESFRLVSERLEQVHKGLGEMQTLATGVGDLKRVLTNVKSRGGWGEVQLAMLLEDLLTPDQYATNVRIRPDSAEQVEFAVRLPGKGDGAPVFLPIDAKFPHEDYERLLLAQQRGDPDEVDRAATALERAVHVQAKLISEKYVHPPHSTDFALLYLPTEGLFAEVVRRPGLCSEVQARHRVMLTGPTTLAALLTSLQMGFRTLAIEQRSSEVWQVLGAAKAEFRKYGDVWNKLGRQLDTARKTVEEAGRRTRAVERRLSEVETTGLQTGVVPSLTGAAEEAAEAEWEVADEE